MKKYGSILWVTILIVIIWFMTNNNTNKIFIDLTKSYPYSMGFVKFAILSIMGEFLATRIISKEWRMIKGVIPKMIIWGILGVCIVLMFNLYTNGVIGAINDGLLPSFNNSKFAIAIYISTIMNLTFGPVFMAAHRITDTIIDNIFNSTKIKPTQALSKIDWNGFLSFVILKTIPLFWIPAHTITFLMPSEYKVVFAASLSIVLGLILSFARMRN